QTVSSLTLSTSLAFLLAAATDDVKTTRCTLDLMAASTTRRVPSRAGAMSSSGFLGWESVTGDATWRTKSHPLAAASHPASEVSSAGWKLRRSCTSTTLPSAARTGFSRVRLLTVVRTE